MTSSSVSSISFEPASLKSALLSGVGYTLMPVSVKSLYFGVDSVTW